MGSRRLAWRENLESLVWAIGLALVIRTFVIAPFKIPSGSMRMTLLEGDRILVTKFQYRFREPARGDIVVFRFPADPKRPFIKRLVGMGKDTVEIREGGVIVNGEALKGYGGFQTRHYVNQGSFGGYGQVVDVPPNELFVLGDNSGSSHDSRFWGFVPKRLLIGKAVCIFWPPKRMRILH
jgi:signal peptidase I